MVSSSIEKLQKLAKLRGAKEIDNVEQFPGLQGARSHQ